MSVTANTPEPSRHRRQPRRDRRTPSRPAVQPTGTAAAGRVPVELPHVVMDVDAGGLLRVSIDGVAYPPPAFAPEWTRGSFPQIIDALLAQHRCPLRVSVREADGSTFTDIITPHTRRTHRPGPAPQSVPWDGSPTLAPRVPAVPPVPVPPVLFEVFATGFIPGEDVAVALVLTHTDASGGTSDGRGGGTARALLTGAQLAQSPTGEVFLYGRVSGTLVLTRPGTPPAGARPAAPSPVPSSPSPPAAVALSPVGPPPPTPATAPVPVPAAHPMWPGVSA